MVARRRLRHCGVASRHRDVVERRQGWYGGKCLGACSRRLRSRRPTSFDAEYERRVSVALAPHADETVVTEQDLASLPEPVASYIRQSGAIGQPRVANFRATISGRIRANPTKPWMTFTGEQVNSFGPNPSRSFHMDATWSACR